MKHLTAGEGWKEVKETGAMEDPSATKGKILDRQQNKELTRS